jgi:hypothetical protein
VKKGAAWMENLDNRMKGVRKFTQRMRTDGIVDVFELHDALFVPPSYSPVALRRRMRILALLSLV